MMPNLLTRLEVMGWLQIGEKSFNRRILPKLPKEGIVRLGRGGPLGNERYLIFEWAIWKLLGIEKCPGCGQNWPEDKNPIPKEHRGHRAETVNPPEVPSRGTKL